ncbi:MAG: hypothetical protein ACRC10_03155 [Thermoguttaceae bacterium]
MSIRIRCQHCQSRIDARDDLLGQTRNCPKCRQPILIVPEHGPEQKSLSVSVPNANTTSGFGLETSAPVTGELLPVKLKFTNRYFVLNAERVLAYWEKSQGWMFNVGAGFSQARRNMSAIPDQGTFVLIELQIEEGANGQTIAGMRMYRLSQRGALTAIARLEDEILGKIDGPASLSKLQKVCFLGYLRKNFMGNFLSNASSLIEYLTNDDLTTTHVRETATT